MQPRRPNRRSPATSPQPTASPPPARCVVQSISTAAEATSTAKAYGGGGVQVGVPIASVTSSPSVMGYIGSGANINAGGNVTVDAEAQSNAAQTYTDDITAVDTSTDMITFPQHGLLNGDVVVYTQDQALRRSIPRRGRWPMVAHIRSWSPGPPAPWSSARSSTPLRE